MSDFHRWLKEIGLERHADALSAQDIDLSVAPDLTEQDLEKVGLSVGHRRRFLAAASRIRASAPPTIDAPARDEAAGAQASHVERRQVTVVFSDLVGSTALASELDPEDMRRLLSEYRAAIAAVIRRYEGHVAQYLGDGVLAYFGFPAALEHAAERAVRAGLEIVAAVGRVTRPNGQPLQSRIGIATGQVAGAAGADSDQTVVGETPNLAARLQSLAEPGSVLISQATHQLTEDLFEYLALGEQEVKGYGEPVSVWQALRETAIESRFIAAHVAAAGPIIGREREMAFLIDAWQRATRGDGHVVVLSGEAGMGKSRLLEALVEHVRSEPHRLLRAQCSPYHGNSALYPFVQLLRQQLDLKRDLDDAQSLERINVMLERIERIERPTPQANLLIAQLLELQAQATVSPSEMTPVQRANATFEILEAFLLAPLDDTTVLLLLEDAHWSDPSTRALVERLLGRIPGCRALVVVTHRPELKTSWPEHPHATPLICKQLGRENCETLARRVATRMGLDQAVIREITLRSDGVPLYVEELTKAVLAMQSPSSGAVPVPLTLRDSLTARLDRLGGAKDIAQTAAVIGRQFPHELLAAIAGVGVSELQLGLQQLCESGLVFAVGEGEDRVYSFNHALIQEAAYEGLSRARRQALHAKIADAFESAGTTGSASEPSILAHHYSRAGLPDRAVQFWFRTADRAGEHHAFAESVAALCSALAEANLVTDAERRARLRLDAQMKLGVAAVFLKGPQSSEAGAALAEAHRLAKEANAGPELFQSTWGLYLNAARNRQFDKAKLRGDELLAISEQLGDDDLKFEALHHQWGFAYFMGRTPEILDYTGRGVQRYDAQRHHRFSYTFAGHDPGVCAHCCRATGYGLAGDLAKIKPELEAAIALSDRLQHPLSFVFAQTAACHALYFGGDFDACDASAEQLVLSSKKFDLPVHGAIGSFWLGAARSARGDLIGGLRQMEPTFEPTHGLGFFASLPGLVMVDTLARAGRDRDALALIARLLDEMSDPETGIFVSELWRLRGELVAREHGGDAESAERSLRTALLIARGQEATLLQSRAGISLASYFAQRARWDEARAAIAQSGVNDLPDRTSPEITAAKRLSAELG